MTGPGVVSGRHSFAGEGGGKGLGVIAERRSGTNGGLRLIAEVRGGEKSGGQLSGSLSRRDGQLSVQGDSDRLEHRIVVSNGEEEAAVEVGQRPGSEVQTKEVLYLRTVAIERWLNNNGWPADEEEGWAEGLR
ncbi:hypothetical protein C2S53_008879 [Perilla frutescens var. hirtella]|uniref:Uncharacterized protein n=1 Tax=Perilla frutescens var. hirtella TaxID=608512 RepID=A0AAD4JEX3_PERFH|nr:hypothetical protein C2S53_008879 [Perilla frutescens var. hirtella]